MIRTVFGRVSPRVRAAFFFLTCAFAWILLSHQAMPALFVAAHDGSAPALGFLVGRGYTLEHYLEQWFRTASWLTLAGLIAGAVYLLRRPLHRGLRAQPGMRAPTVLLVALAFGLGGGLAEALLPVARGPLSARDALAMGMLWMIPVSAAIGFLTLAFAVVLVTRAWARPIAAATVVFVFATIALYGVLAAAELRLHAFASLVLAAGIAARLGVLGARRAMGFIRGIRAVAVTLSCAVLAMAVAWGVMDMRSDARALAGLPAPLRGASNVLLIILDTVRASSTSLHGYERRTTPRLEELAAAGVMFERAITPSPWTLPAHASFFTGRDTHELSADYFTPLDSEHATLAERLAANGYATAGFVANLWYGTRATGLARGFQRYEDYRPTAGTLAAIHWLPHRIAFALRSAVGNPTQLGRVHADDVNRRFLHWLDRRKDDRPFFAFLNYVDAHHPYETAPPFETRFTDRPPRYWLYEGANVDYDASTLTEIRDAYDAAVAYTDDRLGMLLDTLARRGSLDNTLVIVTSDHGELLGEHGLTNHGNALYMQLLHVPLVIRLPDRRYAGVRVSQPVTLRDLPATVLELAGLKGELPGHSMRPLWTESTDPPLRPLLSEARLPPERALVWGPVRKGTMRSVVAGPLHYILNGDGLEELYDHVRDPEETRDLAHVDEKADLGPFRATLRRVLGDREDRAVADGAAGRAGGQ